MVVPVDAGGAAREVGDPDTGGVSGTDEVDEPLSALEPQEPDSVVPILKYSREPNKYGRTAVPVCPPHAPLKPVLTLALRSHLQRQHVLSGRRENPTWSSFL